MDDDTAFGDAVVRFYENNPKVLDKLRAILRGKVPGVSLRMLDCLVTNYSKAKNVIITRPDGTSVHVYQQYKAHLRGYSKKKFDPFARRGRVVVQFSTGAIETTIAQLSFFRWAISTGVVDYASDHSADLEAYYTNSRGGKVSTGMITDDAKKIAPVVLDKAHVVVDTASHVLMF